MPAREQEEKFDFTGLSSHIDVCRDTRRAQLEAPLVLYALRGFIASRFATTVFVIACVAGAATVFI
jgi:hypothetical protein